MTAFLVVNRGSNAATKRENSLEDWGSFLHLLWLEKTALNPVNPEFYSDAKRGSQA